MSLGINTPAGVRYLILEGRLASTATTDDYKLELYSEHEYGNESIDELVVTSSYVVWSRGNAVRAAYCFDLEGEEVRQALLTHFPDSQANDPSDTSTPPDHGTRVDVALGRTAGDTHSTPNELSQALVVLLTSRIHIYVLHGAHHVVKLPFPVDRAFPISHGILLQRPRVNTTSQLLTPEPPQAPHNSFFSSQAPTMSSFLQSPSLQKSLGSRLSQKSQASQGEALFTSLWKNTIAASTSVDDQDEDALFTLTDPLAELGLVAQTRPMLSHLIRRSNNAKTAFDSIDAAEQVIYVTSGDELTHRVGQQASGLILLVTHNSEQQTITIWHGWYLDERALSKLISQQKQQKADKLRRRSSFVSNSIATGTTTPAVRPRDFARESTAHTQATTRSRAQSSQVTEATFASQLDPDLDDDSQTLGKDGSRRISSIVSRGELTVTDSRLSQPAASFTTASFRRNASLGLNERRSLGLRRSRASTPGSVLSRSLLNEDHDMESDSDIDKDEDEVLTDAAEQIKASYESMNSEFLVGVLDEGWRQDFTVRRIHTMHLPHSEARRSATSFKVDIIRASAFVTKARSGPLLRLIVHDLQTRNRQALDLVVKQIGLAGSAKQVAIPVVIQKTKLEDAENSLHVRDRDTEGMLLDGGRIMFPSSNLAVQTHVTAPYYARPPLQVLDESPPDKDVGRRRVLPAPEQPILSSAAALGIYHELKQVRHRRQVQLTPAGSLHRQIISVFELTMRDHIAAALRPALSTIRRLIDAEPDIMVGTACDAEWTALLAAMFSSMLALIDQKCIASAKVARIATQKQTSKHRSVPNGRNLHAMRLFKRRPWSDIQEAPASTIQSSVRSKPDQALLIALSLADDYSKGTPDIFPVSSVEAMKLMLGLHVLREEHKLNICQQQSRELRLLPPLIAQLGQWLGSMEWSFEQPAFYHFEGASELLWAYTKASKSRYVAIEIMDAPIGVMEWLEHSVKHQSAERYPDLVQVADIAPASGIRPDLASEALRLTPKTALLSEILVRTQVFSLKPDQIVETIVSCGLTEDTLEGLPPGVATPIHEAVRHCEHSPPSTWTATLLEFIGRQDLDMVAKPSQGTSSIIAAEQKHDVKNICAATEQAQATSKSREADRNAVSQLIFHEDRRLVHAASLLHFNTVQIAECAKQPEWSDAFYFEQQRRVMQYVSIRTTALPTGDAMLHFGSQTPLLTERFHLPGFSSSCIMQPMGHTVTTDRSGLTEDKISWAYFHAGVSTGLKISRTATGIDTSWLSFNKPHELTNRHAGLLLALGLNGHLKHIAKWLSFKYLTPKHAMTSLGLLLGLAASNIGTMDSLITRMLSVHVTCMLPPGAAELNVSPLTQAGGLVGIGLLYYNTQHRRMSETMLHEVETMGTQDPDNGADNLRDESYRLAAGFSLGLINLAKGKSTTGLHGMQLSTRLLRMAIGPRPVKAVHVFDKATAGAIMSLALIFMKTGDEGLARKIDVPSTKQQFEYVRPDMLMLRSMAKHLIMWKSIDVSSGLESQSTASWIVENLPRSCKAEWKAFESGKTIASSADLPLFYIATGLAWALALKYAGTGNVSARNDILSVLDMAWHSLRKRPDGNFFFDSKAARIGLRRCIDVLALFASAVMAGSGDLITFRYLRRLHGRTDAETLYGSHLASHMGIGLLFLGGGTMTLGNSDLAVAALICSLYPLFPTDVQDNRVHLQALRHLWVFAIEPRCVTVEDIDTGRPVEMPVEVKLKSGEVLRLESPRLLPALDDIAMLRTVGNLHWPVVLDLTTQSSGVDRFRARQKIFVKQCPPFLIHQDPFWSTFTALSMPAISNKESNELAWFMGLRALVDFTEGDLDTTTLNPRGSVVDERLLLQNAIASNDRNVLWDLRVLFAWAEHVPAVQRKDLRWLGYQFIQKLRRQIEQRQRQLTT